MIKFACKIMGLFTKFKTLFNKTINLLPHQRNDVVSFVRLRSGSVKVGSEAVVEEDYKLIFVYYNKVCDILNEGTHKINDDSIPRLFKMSKAYLEKKSLFVQSSIKTDAYFVCTKEFNHNMFKTQEKIAAYSGDEKVKLRIEGTFTFKVVDVEKFMVALCNDYAIIRNKKTMKEIRSTVGFETSKALNKMKFSLDDYIFNKEKICRAIEEGVNAHTETFGVQVSKFFINNVIVPRKHLSAEQIRAVDKVETINNPKQEEDVVKLVEERLNNLQKELNVVYVNEKGENSFENAKTEQVSRVDENFNPQPNLGAENAFVNPISNQQNAYAEVNENSQQFNSNVENNNQNNFTNTNFDNYNFSNFNQPEPNIITPDPQVIEPQSQQAKPTRQRRAPKQEDIQIDDELVDTLIDKINTRKKQKKNNRIVEILTSAGVATGAEETSSNKKSKIAVSSRKCSQCGEPLAEEAKFCFKCGKSTDELKICACCGAKNFAVAEMCCVCKSKLD